jgi:hypothetical protein
VTFCRHRAAGTSTGRCVASLSHWTILPSGIAAKSALPDWLKRHLKHAAENKEHTKPYECHARLPHHLMPERLSPAEAPAHSC